MTKWVNLYIVIFIINLLALIFFKPYILISAALVLVGLLVVFLSYKNKTTSVVHISMLLISILFLILSLLRV